MQSKVIGGMHKNCAHTWAPADVVEKSAVFYSILLWVFWTARDSFGASHFPSGTHAEQWQRCWRSVHYRIGERESACLVTGCAHKARWGSQGEKALVELRVVCHWHSRCDAIAPFLSISRRNSVISEWSPKHTPCDSVLHQLPPRLFILSQPASIHRPWVRWQFKRWLFAFGTPSNTENHFCQTLYQSMVGDVNATSKSNEGFRN